MTTTTITTSNQYPTVNSAATFTVTLMEGTTGLSQPVRIWHILPSGELHEDVHTTPAQTESISSLTSMLPQANASITPSLPATARMKLLQARLLCMLEFRRRRLKKQTQRTNNKPGFKKAIKFPLHFPGFITHLLKEPLYSSR